MRDQGEVASVDGPKDELFTRGEVRSGFCADCFWRRNDLWVRSGMRAVITLPSISIMHNASYISCTSVHCTHYTH